MHKSVIVLLACMFSYVYTQSLKYCFVLDRKDAREIWYIGDKSVLCKDWEYFAEEEGPAKDFQLVVHNSTIRLVIDNSYTTFEDNFLTGIDKNLTVSLKSSYSSVPMFFTIDLDQAVQNRSLFQKLVYSEEEYGGAKLRRWTLMLNSTAIYLEGSNSDLWLSTSLHVSYYVFYAVHLYFPNLVSLEFISLFISLTVLTRIPMQEFLSYFGFVAGYVSMLTFCWIASHYLSRISTKYHIGRALTSGVLVLYIIGQSSDIVFWGLGTIGVGLAWFFALRKFRVTLHEKSLVLEVIILLNVTLSNFYQNPFITYYKIYNNSLGYTNHGGYYFISLMASLSASCLHTILLVFTLYWYERSGVMTKRLKAMIENHYDISGSNTLEN